MGQVRMNGLQQRIAALSPEQRDALWAKLGVPPTRETQREIPRRVSQDPCPLSFAQQRLWFLHQLELQSPAYNIPLALRLTGRLDVTSLDEAFREIVRRHEALRTTFAIIADQPSQVIASAGTFALRVRDLGDQLGEAREAEAQRLAIEEARQPFDLARGPMLRVLLLRLAPADHILVITIHHIASDGWSVGVLTRELAALYDAYHDGRPSPLGELPIQYADFAAWQRAWLQGEVLEQQLAYWRTQLSDAPALQLPTDHPRPIEQTYVGATRRFTLAPAMVEALRALTRREGLTLATVILAAFKVVLHRYTGQCDIVVGQAIANRNRREIEGLIGVFVNSLTLRTDLSGDPPFVELAGRLHRVALGAYDHQDLPFEKLVEELQPERNPSQHPLFQVMCAFQNAPFDELRLRELVLSIYPLEIAATRFDLELDVWERSGEMQCEVVYNTDLFERATIERLVRHFQLLLGGVVRDPGQRISRLPLLGEDERQQIVVEWNRTERGYPRAATVHGLFEEQVARMPEAVALRFEGRELTYRELNARANQLAHRLRALGVGPEVLVAVCLERSLDLVVGLLGVLKAGGAYVPLDPSYPPARLAFMLADAQAPVVLTQERLAATLPAHSAQVLCMDREAAALARESPHNPAAGVTAEHLAYVIYTSGSTGQPKGAMNAHRGVCNRLLWMQEAYQLTEADRVLQKTPFSFDVSVWEFFWPLLNGAVLVVAPPEIHADGVALRQLIRREDITTLHFVPSMLEVFLETPEVAQCDSIKRIICSGEALSARLQDDCLKQLGVELHNLYGPTEAAIDVTHWTCQRGEDQHSVPIGRPVANTQLYVLDEHSQPVPIGVVGELYIGGVQVGRGYLNRPELTADRFVPDPFGPQGARLYRTGDLARYRADGVVEFVGRADGQVKLRGFRIELGEIEAVLAQLPGVSQAAVVLRADFGSDPRLVAYLVPAGQAPALDEVRRSLGERLPVFMVPSAFVVLEALPLTPSGKLDRRALPVPDAARSDHVGKFVAPRNAVEQMLAGIWLEVLGLDTVGVHDNFFQLGGHSLLATQLVSRVRDAFLVELPLASIFAAPTIAGLVWHIERAEASPGRSVKIAGLMHKLKTMPPTDREALLEQARRVRTLA
jgi:amino acid adenylation domain-containing protein